MRVPQSAALIATVICLGCADSSGPLPALAGTYELRAVNGQPLPITFGDTADAAVRLLSGRIVALPQQHFTRDQIQEQWEAGAIQQTDTVPFASASSFYQVTGATVQFYLVVPASPSQGFGTDTVPAFSGTLSEMGSVLTLTVDDALAGAGARLRYARE